MADTDLIARVYPYAEKRRTEVPEATLEAFKTSPGCFDPLGQLSERWSASRRERESTEPLDTQNGPVLDTLPYVELRLSDTPRFRSGFLFGWGQNNDVVLPQIRGVGRHHFTLTFDGEKRPIVKDWGSLNGTQVTYGSQGHGARSGFQWIVGGHKIPFKKQPIVVTALARALVRLQIVVVPHNVASLAYIDKVDQLLQSTAAATEDLLSGLNIANRSDTQRPTGAPKLETGPIHIRKRLGEGSFASVAHYWDVSTGEEYALKKPSAEAVRARRVRINAWRNEAHIMNLIRHPHVVKLLKSDFTQGPRLYLEYVPRGSLANQCDISAAECVSILQQCLSALEYLHGSDPPIVHRDIKADNILVQYRDTNSIYVKFADFGLAKDYNNMSTICGNFGNLAPEVYQNHQYIEAGGKGRVSYTEAVDVWSLGVMVYKFLCPLPQFENQYISRGTAWAKKLIKMFKKDFEERPDELRRFLLEAMVVLRPEQRWSAGDCLARAMLLPVPAMDQSETAVAVSYVSDDERSTIRYKAEPNMAQGLEIPMWQPGSSENSTLSTDAGRYDRSGAPTPRASVPASASSRKRATVSRPSSSGRHRKRREHGSSSSKADAGSRQQRDRVLNNRTQDSLPPVAFEDNDEDEDDWDREEDDNARVELPHAVDHLSTSHVGQEVESHMQTFLQHQVGNGGADQEAVDAAVMFQRLNQHGIMTPFESMARTSGEAAASTIASSYGERDAQGDGLSHFPGNYILAPPRQDGGGGQNNSAGVDRPCGDDPTGPASQVDSQPSGLFSSGDPLNPLLVGSSVAAWGGAGEESTAGTAPSHTSVVEEDDDLPPPWSPAHPLSLYAADTQYLRSPRHSQRLELQLATHSSVVVAHPHFPPSLAEGEVEENGDRLTGHFTEPAPYVGHPYSAYGLGDNDQLLDDDWDEGTAEGHEEADGGVDDYTPPEPPSAGAAASPGPQLPKGYRAFHVEGSSHAVVYRPVERKVNALQLVGIRKISRNSLKMCFARHPEIRTERHRRPQVAGLSGPYVDFDDARIICKSFHMPTAVIDELETAAAATVAVTGGDGGYALQTEGEAEAGPAQAVQRRKRTSYSAAHKAILEAAFRNNPKPETRKYCELATQLSTEMRQVQVWFQNRRQRERRETKRDVGLLQC
ncbi:hypothetical protein RB594_008443 [Gaeumannomyces avenae]